MKVDPIKYIAARKSHAEEQLRREYDTSQVIVRWISADGDKFRAFIDGNEFVGGFTDDNFTIDFESIEYVDERLRMVSNLQSIFD